MFYSGVFDATQGPASYYVPGLLGCVCMVLVLLFILSRIVVFLQPMLVINELNNYTGWRTAMGVVCQVTGSESRMILTKGVAGPFIWLPPQEERKRKKKLLCA